MKQEERLNEILQDEKNKKDFQTPVRAFITFLNQEGHERCRKFLFKDSEEYLGEKKELKILGHPIEMSETANPSDIIWENLEVPKSEKNWGFIKGLLLMIIALMMSASISFYLRSQKRKFNIYNNNGKQECNNWVLTFKNIKNWK